MGDAGHAVALRPEREEPVRSGPIERIVESYLSAADGEARDALRQAVADGVEAASLVSRGFARWGWSDREGRR